MPYTVDDAVKRALELHAAGFNCAQSVACACARCVGLDEDTAFRLMEGFGGGMGNFTQTCGAISGGVATLGFLNSRGLEKPGTKAETYKLASALVKRFEESNGSTLCGDLKGLNGTPARKTCDGYIEEATRITLDIVAHHRQA